jgi:DNA (cytosine-5)-methyltransferase 1
MENVPNSKNYVKDFYTFRQLKLVKWAVGQKINPDAVALNVRNQGHILNTADFGTSQRRERFLCGEIVASEKFPELDGFKIKQHRTVHDVRSKMPPPNLGESEKTYVDPNYPSLKLRAKEIADHFYDSGVYECQWRDAHWLKVNHPYMGRMSFPENEYKPSRTVMATQSASTREALIYKSEYDRQGDGQYRLPTIREIATLMGFPYSYRFAGSESNKWRQVGNAVCPHLSSALAKSVRLAMGLQIIPDTDIKFEVLAEEKSMTIENLNTFCEKKFNDPPKKNPKARFRRHPFKDGNMTVALTNFNPKSKHKNGSHIDWFTSVFFGAGKDFKANVIPRNAFKRIGKFIEAQHNGEGTAFIEKFEKHFQKAIGSSDRFQAVFVGKTSSKNYDPRKLIDEIGDFILKNEPKEKLMEVPDWISKKEKTPTRQVLTIYAINRIIS